MDGPQLHQARHQRLGLPQGNVGGDIGLQPLVQGQARGGQKGDEDITHGWILLVFSDVPYLFFQMFLSLHAFPRKSNRPQPSQYSVRFSSKVSPSFLCRASEAVLPRRTWQ